LLNVFDVYILDLESWLQWNRIHFENVLQQHDTAFAES